MAKEGFLGALGRFAANIADAAPEGTRNVWSTVGPWVGELTRSASQVWVPHLLLGIPCEVLFRDLPCPLPAIAACSVCRKPTCLNHAFAASSAQAICFPCVKRAIAEHAPIPPRVEWPPHTRGHQTHPGAPPPEDAATGAAGHSPPPSSAPPDPLLRAQLSQARKILKVKRNTSWADVEASYKALLRKHHPDRNPQDRDRAEEQYKVVRGAYDLLKLHEAHP